MSDFDPSVPSAPDDTGASYAPTTTSATAPQAATPPAPQGSATAPSQGGPPEGWVPSYRIREAREAAVRQANESFAQREAEIRAEADRYRQQLQALVGVTPPQHSEHDAVRAQFAQLYPRLAQLEERGEDVLGVLERAGDLEAQTQHYWQSYGQQAMTRLFSQASQALGSPLADEGKRALHSAFIGYVQSSPELTERYANDPGFVDEFWRAFSSNFIDPARRVASAGVAGRAQGHIPQDSPGGVPRATPAPSAGSIDDRVGAAWALYQQTARGQS